MKSITHVYPLRKTSQAWKIPLVIIHICDESCLYKISQEIINDEFYLITQENPDFKNGKCTYFGKKIFSPIRLKFFDIKNSSIENNLLYRPDEIVIPDARFNVIVNYPLRNPVQISMFAPSEKGFTRASLIDSLQKIYDFIYREEERTATPTIYEYREICSDCTNKDKKKFLKKRKIEGEICSICYNSGKYGVDLPCGHNFHKKCILSWLNENNTCPLCRKYVIQCKSCNGLGFISRVEQNVVIPPEYRGVFRNTTDGIFGIWGYDFEDLYLEELFYNRKRKILQIFIRSHCNNMQ